MTHPAFDVLIGAARHLEAREGTVGSGSTSTSIIDSNWGMFTQAPGAFKGGTYLQKKDGASTWDAVRSVSGSSTLGELTLSSALPGAPTAGEAYVVLGNAWPFTLLCQKLMDTVAEYGDTVELDTSLTTAADQYEYSYPADTTTAARVLQVGVETTAGSGRYEQALGVVISDHRGKILFPYMPPAGLKICLTIAKSNQVTVSLASLPTLPDSIHPAWASLEVAARVARWRLMQTGDQGQKETARVQDLFARAAALRARYQPRRPQRQPMLPFTEVR